MALLLRLLRLLHQLLHRALWQAVLALATLPLPHPQLGRATRRAGPHRQELLQAPSGRC
jgi:hypothetical protein